MARANTDDSGPDAPETPSHTDRRDTDESLRAERDTADELIDTELSHKRVGQAVRDSREEAGERIQEVRNEADARRGKQSGRLPEVSQKLEQVASSLSNAAARLTGVVKSLTDAKTEQPEPVDLVTNMAQLAERVKEIAGGASETPHHPEEREDSGTLTEQLAEIADGMAEVTATLAEERRDVDETMLKERRVTDEIITQELEQVQAALALDLDQERDVLAEEREATDDYLAAERHHTDEAVEHVLGLLGQEKREHAVAERNYATRNEFLGIVSHDLRGPLMTIAGVATLIEQNIPADDTGRTRAWTDSIKRSVGVMERLIGDLLDFGSFEDGRLRVTADSHDIRDLVRHTVDAFQPVASGKKIVLEVELPDEPVMAMYDDHRIQQVLSNVIHNAIKFTPDCGSIRVRVERSGTDCVVAVADTGIGIPQNELTTIFQRFRQLDGTARTGLGLGLYISMWIIEAHGGRIWAESRVGAGSTFYFTLPLESE
jgi:signal transduction histidine kinase